MSFLHKIGIFEDTFEAKYLVQDCRSVAPGITALDHAEKTKESLPLRFFCGILVVEAALNVLCRWCRLSWLGMQTGNEKNGMSLETSSPSSNWVN